MRPADFPFAAMFDVEVLARPGVMVRSHDVYELRSPRAALVVWSLSALRHLLRGVRWHDDAEHCRTWSAGCRCDLGDES